MTHIRLASTLLVASVLSVSLPASAVAQQDPAFEIKGIANGRAHQSLLPWEAIDTLTGGVKLRFVDFVEAAIGDPQQWNRYAYALNNPMGNSDPDGRSGTVVGGLFGGVMGGGVAIVQGRSWREIGAAAAKWLF